MPHYNIQSLCIRCKHLRPSLDPNLQKAYLGQCLKREWPFTLSITLEGWTECEIFEESSKGYVQPDPALVNDFGSNVPALLIFEGDRYPTLVYPRTDAQRGLIRVEQALEELLTLAGEGVSRVASR